MPRSKRDPSRRVGWSKLSPAYRARIESKMTRAQWEAGADLRATRGHAPKPPRTAAPQALTRRLVEGEATPADLREVGLFTRPGWIPRGMRDDVAAALSQIPYSPSRWDRVEFLAAPDGAPWTMIVHPKGNAYPVEILIPGGGAVGTGARDILDLLTDPKLAGADMRYWKKWAEMHDIGEAFEVMGSK